MEELNLNYSKIQSGLFTTDAGTENLKKNQESTSTIQNTLVTYTHSNITTK
jgi:hypothetical protein